MGGEKLYEQMEQGAGKGSPPRGRGKADVCSTLEVALGITPAWAGKSWLMITFTVKNVDHPRVGGEKM